MSIKLFQNSCIESQHYKKEKKEKNDGCKEFYIPSKETLFAKQHIFQINFYKCIKTKKRKYKVKRIIEYTIQFISIMFCIFF